MLITTRGAEVLIALEPFGVHETLYAMQTGRTLATVFCGNLVTAGNTLAGQRYGFVLAN